MWGECHPAPGAPPGGALGACTAIERAATQKASPGAEMPLEPHKLWGTGMGEEPRQPPLWLCLCPEAEWSLRCAIAVTQCPHWVLERSAGVEVVGGGLALSPGSRCRVLARSMLFPRGHFLHVGSQAVRRIIV